MIAQGSWLVVASAICAVGLVVLVHLRFEVISRLSWLDATMGASSAGALAAALGAGVPAIVAAAGVFGSLALSRWRPGWAHLLGAGGLALLGAGLVIAAAPLLIAAVLWPKRRARPAEFLSWPVLVALIVFALVAVGLLASDRFAPTNALSALLATVTVLAGVTRAALTVMDRLRVTERLARTDMLTGLGNRRSFLDRLDADIEEAQRMGRQVALLLIDLDGFKELNDTLGHYAGDEVLRLIGPRLKALLRHDDTFARLGGDEFAVALVPGDEALAATIAQRLCAALQQPFEVQDIALHVDASVGVALCPEHARDAVGLLQRADVAMYEAKRMRTGHEFYLPERDRQSRRRLSLISELHSAIAAGELQVEYQPQAELVTGNVRGMEALVRWVHPSLGRIAPQEFLPLVEQSGQAHALTRLVLDRALEQIGQRRAEGFALTVAVNLGPADLLHRGLPLEIKHLLEGCRFPAEALKLEITERSLLVDLERITHAIARLREFGVGISLDDFGTGNGSLANLRQLKVDELKIDCSFVLRMTQDHRDAAIVHSTIDLAHRLGLRACAEGVETEATFALLADDACDDAQGYFIMPPMAEDTLARWLRAISEPKPAIPAATPPMGGEPRLTLQRQGSF